jgi:hypothetical protein
MTQPYIVKAYNYAVTKAGTSTAPTLTKLYDHFQSTSTLWEVDAGSSTSDPSKSFTIRPKTGLQFQINFRRFDSTTNRVNVTIDPDGLITDSLATVGGVESALPSTASAKAFNNINAFRWNLDALVGEGLWLIELDNALFIMNKIEDIRSIYGFHIGRILTPIHENDPSKGMEGFGILGNQLGWTRAGSSSLDSAIMNVTTTGFRSLKVSNLEASKTVDVYLNAKGSTATTGDLRVLDVGGRRQPATVYAKINNVSGRYLGVLKYIHTWPVPLASGIILTDTMSSQKFIYNNPISGSQNFAGILLPWEDGVNQF